MLEIQYSKDLIEEEKAKAEAETEKKEATTGVETDEMETETTSNDANTVEDSVEAEDEENPADEEVQEERTLKGQELQIPEFLLRGERGDANARASRTSATPSRRNVKPNRFEKLVKVEKKQSTNETETETTSEQETLRTTKGKVDTASDSESKTRKNNAEDVVYHHTSTDSEVYRKKKKKKLSDILKGALVICAVAVAVLIIMQANKLYSSRLQTDSDGNLYRNLDYKVSQLPEEPAGRTVSWDNELSGFVEDDFAKVKKNKTKLTYEYGSEKLFFEYEDGNIWLNIGSVGDIRNCSIYKNSNNEIIVYGTNTDEEFVKFCFSKLQAGYIFLGNYNVPLNIETTTVAELIDGYYLCIDENKVFACKDKKVVTTANYNIKSKVSRVISTNIGGYYSSYPLIYTEDKSLYLPIVVASGDENVKVEMKHLISDIDIPDSISQFNCIDVDDYWLSIPMYENGSESILFIPSNMDMYSEYFYNEKPMESDDGTDWKAVPLKQQIIKATINCRNDDYITKNDWYVRLYINVADKIATYEYKLDGIDTCTEVPDAEKESYNCYSEDEYWNAVEEIRSLYSRYYSQRP